MPKGDKHQGKTPRKMTLKIQHGSGAVILVRDWENQSQGEGRQVIQLINSKRNA
jgi:hypothetical protein